MRTPEAQRRKRGSTCSRKSGLSSRGGPGSNATMRPLSSIHRPGAVPRGFSRTSAPSGTMAWRRFTAGMSRLKLRNLASIARTTSSFRCRRRPRSSATVSRVRSSSVGPRPPLAITTGTRFSASRNASASSSRLSPTIVFRKTSMPSLFNSSVMKSELVSTRSGVRSSDPTAMISAFMGIIVAHPAEGPGGRRFEYRRLTVEGQPADVPINGKQGAVGGEDAAAVGEEGEADQSGAAEEVLGVALGRDANDAAAATERGHDEEVSVLVEGEALRAAEAAIEDVDFAVLGDAIDAVVTGGGGAADVEFAAWMESEVIGGEGGLERGEDEDFALRADFENGAAAVADEQIASCIEGDAGGDPHAFDPLFAAAVGSDAIDGAVVAAGNEEVAACVERQAGGIYKRSDEGFHGVAGIDFVERDGNTLAARPAEGHVNVSLGIYRGIADRMQVVGDLESQGHGKRLAFALRTYNLDGAAVGVFRYAGDQAVAAGERERRFRFAKADERAGAVPRGEAAAINRDLATGDCGGGRNSLNVRDAVLFWCRTKTEFHCCRPRFIANESVTRDASKWQRRPRPSSRQP